ncbi:hypothetical protein F5Y09DRAFT_140456 [Xylaria sp. FL1042]|nr:hypothetical protein F5Y09DRAFT_140456 [Xylaria sp. FL1042]
MSRKRPDFSSAIPSSRSQLACFTIGSFNLETNGFWFMTSYMHRLGWATEQYDHLYTLYSFTFILLFHALIGGIRRIHIGITRVICLRFLIFLFLTRPLSHIGCVVCIGGRMPGLREILGTGSVKSLGSESLITVAVNWRYNIGHYF